MLTKKYTFNRYFYTLLLSIIMFNNTGPLFAAEKFTLDNQHSYVQWHIKHLGFSTQTGKWYVTGFVTLDKENPKNSNVEVTINVANMITGIPDLDKHLKGKLFFDVEHYPTATFVSNKIDVLNKTSAKVHGILTLHGISKPVTLMVSLNKIGKDLIYDRMTAGFSASTEIKRSSFGIMTLLPDVGDDVVLEIGAEAYLPNPQGTKP